jgi:GTP pyrophosphokinase
VIAKAFGESQASLVAHARKLLQVQRAAQAAQVGRGPAGRANRARAQDAAGVSRAICASCCFDWRLACRPCATSPPASARAGAPGSESLQVFAPLANRLGIWQIKWELEDLAFRFLEPEKYKQGRSPAG